AAVERHALQGELAQVDVTAAVAAGDVVVGVLALARSARLVLDGDVVVAHVVQPGHAVAAAVEAGDARGVADGQVHGAPGQVQVLGDLGAGLAGADHQHRAFGQGVGVTVVRGMQLSDVGGQSFGEAGHDRLVVAARGHHHLPGVPA